MKLARRYNTLACFTAFLAAIAYCVADDGTLLLAILTIIACASAWRTSRADRPWTLPRWLVNLFMLAAIVDATLKVLSTQTFSGFWTGGANTPIVSTLSQFLVYILLAKLFDRRTARDEAHLLSLSIFVVVGAVLTSNSLGVGFLVLAFAPCVICAAMLLQLVGGARAVQDSASSHGFAVEKPADILAAPGRRFRRDFAVVAVAAVVGTIAFSTLAFVLMPRGLWKDSLGGFGKVQAGASIGFTDQIRLGNTGYLQDDHTPILNVRLTDAEGHNLGELRGTLYLRGVVKDKYHRSNGAWTGDEPSSTGRASDRSDPPVSPDPLVSPDSDPPDPLDIFGAPTGRGGARAYETGPDDPLLLGQRGRAQIVVRQEITLRRPIRAPGYFFTLWRPIEFNTSAPALVQPPGRDMVLRASGHPPSLKSYTVTSSLEYSDDLEPTRQNVRFNSTIIRDIAQNILTERTLPVDPTQRDPAANRRVALAFTDYLRTTCVYDRDQIAPEADEDPIEMFLTRTQRGHCEYFASAMVAMCQSVGLDARLVGGYLATEFNRVTSEYVVRESNAHAWTEVRIAPGRWQTFDPSPPDAIDAIHKPPFGIVARLRQWYEAINFTWGSTVVSFDGRTQQQLVGSAEGWRGFFGRAGDFLASIRRQFAGVAGIARLGVLAVVIATVVWAARRSWKRRRRAGSRADAGAIAAPPDPALARLLEQAGFYSDALALLDRSGLAKPGHRPPVLHARSLAGADAFIADAFDALSNFYYAVRFGRRPLTAEEIADAAGTLAALEQRLHTRNIETLAAARNGPAPISSVPLPPHTPPHTPPDHPGDAR